MALTWQDVRDQYGGALPEEYHISGAVRPTLTQQQITDYRQDIWQYLAYQQNTQATIDQYRAEVAAANQAYMSQVAAWQSQMQQQVAQNISSYEGLSAEALQAYIDQLAAQYGYQSEDILSQIAAIDPALQAAMQQLATYKEQGLEETENAALERGILQSGIYAKGVGSVLTDVAQQEMGVRKQAADQQEALEIQAARLPEQQAYDTAIAQSDQAMALAQFRTNQQMALMQAMMPQGPLPVAAPIIAPFIAPPEVPIGATPTMTDLASTVTAPTITVTTGGSFDSGVGQVGGGVQPGGGGAGTGAPTYVPLSYVDLIAGMTQPQRPAVVSNPYTPVLLGGR